MYDFQMNRHINMALFAVAIWLYLLNNAEIIKLENTSYPPETLYVEMQKEDSKNKADSGLTILDRRESGSGSNLRVLVNGGGYGRANGQYFWILHHPLNKYEFEHIEILFEREALPSEMRSE